MVNTEACAQTLVFVYHAGTRTSEVYSSTGCYGMHSQSLNQICRPISYKVITSLVLNPLIDMDSFYKAFINFLNLKNLESLDLQWMDRIS